MLIVCVKVSQVNKIDHSDFSLFFSEEKKRKRCPFPGLHKASLLISSPNLFSGGRLAQGHVARWKPQQGKTASRRFCWATGLADHSTDLGTTASVCCPLMMTSLSFPQGMQRYKKWAIMQVWLSLFGREPLYQMVLAFAEAPIRVCGKKMVAW